MEGGVSQGRRNNRKRGKDRVDREKSAQAAAAGRQFDGRCGLSSTSEIGKECGKGMMYIFGQELPYRGKENDKATIYPVLVS
jgi:hypothetical protein